LTAAFCAGTRYVQRIVIESDLWPRSSPIVRSPTPALFSLLAKACLLQCYAIGRSGCFCVWAVRRNWFGLSGLWRDGMGELLQSEIGPRSF
jgi:hypothetical protein